MSLELIKYNSITPLIYCWKQPNWWKKVNTLRLYEKFLKLIHYNIAFSMGLVDIYKVYSINMCLFSVTWINSPTVSKRKLLCLSGGCLLDPHVECGFNYKYFPINSVVKFQLMEDILLWKKDYSSQLVNTHTKTNSYGIF